jgi:hypothetical protein
MAAGLPSLCGCMTAFKVVGRCCHHVSWMASRFIPTRRGPLGSSIKAVSSTTPKQQLHSARPSRKLLVTATFMWATGLLGAVSYFVWEVPDLEFTVFSLSLFVSGVLLRRRRKAGGVLAIATFGMAGILQLATGAVLTVDFTITVVILLLVLTVWRELR